MATSHLTVAPDDSQRLHRVPAVAKTLDVSEKTVWRMIADGRLERVKIGRSVRVTAESLERYIDEIKAAS